MNKSLIILVFCGILWSGDSQQEIRIPPLGPYFKDYESGIRKLDPIVLMELCLDAREHAGCIVFEEQTKAAILKKVEAMAEAGDAYAMYLMARGSVGRYSGTNPWYQRSADAGDPFGQLWFGAHVVNSQRLDKTAYLNIDGKSYIKRAYTTFKNRAEKGDRKALYILWTGGFENKIIAKTEKDELEAKLFNLKDRFAYRAMYDKAAMRLDPNVIKHKEEILRLVHESAEGGELEAMRFLKFYYYEGGCPREYADPKKPKNRNISKAWEWARREWAAMGCQGEMPTPIDYNSEPWKKPGEKKK